jgi:hypothetical protein
MEINSPAITKKVGDQRLGALHNSNPAQLSLLMEQQLINSLKPKVIYITFKNSVDTTKKTQQFIITKIN